MTLHEDDPACILLARADYLEAMSNCLELVAGTLRFEGRQAAAEAITHAIREQRIQAMLVRGQLAAW